MPEQIAQIRDGFELCYETFGSPDDPPLLLVMGLGTQMVGWPDGFCEQLAARGFHAIRFDNRDIGRSTHLRDRPVPTIKQLALRDKRAAAYSLGDMAQDAVDLLDHLGIERAHVVGASMGGMIAQLVAARHQDRTLSLASIMSNTGHRFRGMPGLRVYPIFFRRPTLERDGAIEAAVSTFRLIGSPGLFDEDELRRIVSLSYDRGYDPAGAARQLAAIVTSSDRAPELAHVTVPTVVIHGTKDRMVTPSGGRATARAIPGAQLVMIEGMGHDLPASLWDRIVGAIAANAARADAPEPRAAAA
jgi:pimeloyl-ACP methyl ester carboxylesterase